MGVALLPGYVFFPMQDGGRDYIRICYSFESDERLAIGMRIIKKMLVAAGEKTN